MGTYHEPFRGECCKSHFRLAAVFDLQRRVVCRRSTGMAGEIGDDGNLVCHLGNADLVAGVDRHLAVRDGNYHPSAARPPILQLLPS
jgi:hypothetical protein